MVIDIQVSGDLYDRASRNFDRLEREEYRPDTIFKPEAEWPGDWEGRTLLGLVLLAQAVHREPRYLEEILASLPGHLNERGFFGPIPTGGIADEQQLSGNSWFLRALAEGYEWRGDRVMLDMAGKIVENLIVPAAGLYSRYPLSARTGPQGKAAGNLAGTVVDGWRLSTDIGCAFIMLDGMTHAYALMPTAGLQAVIEEAIARFAEADLAGLNFQTHATLSALRGILRYYAAAPRRGLLDLAERIFALYTREALTENYANYNWFGRPSWTEPCAYIDSFVAAVGLWRLTGKPAYLDFAHHVYYNAMGYGQRPSGGWGCDICAGAEDVFLAPYVDCFEAFWCCTMRGGEGLARAVEFTYAVDGDRVTLPFYHPGTVRLTLDDGELVLRQSTEYPVEGKVKLAVIASSIAKAKTFRFFVPGWSGNAGLRLNGRPVQTQTCQGFVSLDACLATGDLVELAFEVAPRIVPAMNPCNLKGCVSYRHGALILGCAGEAGAAAPAAGRELLPLGGARYRLAGSGEILEPVNDLYRMTTEDARNDRRRILFRG